MAGETQITITGNVVDDAVDLRFTPGGAAVAKFRIASTPRTFDKQSNQFKDGDPLFLTVNVWRQQAESVAESIAKGTRVVVVGALRMRTYDTKDGQKRTVYEIEAEDVAVSLKFATAKVTRANRSGGQGGQQRQAPQDPWASSGQGGWGAPQTNNGDEPPF